MSGRVAPGAPGASGAPTAPEAVGAGARLRVDPAVCDGVGQCARLAPDLVTLDRWGYPRVAERPLTESERRAAERAARACPFTALWFQPTG